MLLFSLGVSIVSGVLFGIAPAIRATRTDLTSALKEKSAHGRKRRLNLGSALVVAQVAVSLILLVGAGLFARSLIKLQQEDLGFNRDNVLLAGIDMRLAGYKPNELSAVYRQLYDRLSTLPNVRSATIASYSPMQGTSTNSTITVRGYTPAKDENVAVSGHLYRAELRDAGVPLLMGREFNLQDTPDFTSRGHSKSGFREAILRDENPIGRAASLMRTPTRTTLRSSV